MFAHTTVQTLDPAMVSFITGHQSIHVAASNDQYQVSLVRGIGCRVNEDRDRITVLLPRSQSEPLLRAISGCGKIAVVFCEPDTHRSVQFKGQDACQEPVINQDKAGLADYIRGLSIRLKKFGVSEIYVHTLCACPADDIIAVGFTPLNVYQQTPGAEAGNQLLPGALLP